MCSNDLIIIVCIMQTNHYDLITFDNVLASGGMPIRLNFLLHIHELPSHANEKKSPLELFMVNIPLSCRMTLVLKFQPKMY